MRWLLHLNPFRYLAGRIFLWFWFVILSAVFVTLAMSRALVERTEIRRLPPPVIEQVQQQLQGLADSRSAAALIRRLQRSRPDRWLVVDAQSNTVLTPGLLPADFDQNWLTELSQLNRPRWLRHDNITLAGPFLIELNGQQLALYQKRERTPKPWWHLTEMPQHVLLLFTLLISAVASFTLAVSISRPLRELLLSNLQFAEGKLDSRVRRLVRRQDELGQLGHSFNTMAERISNLLRNQQRLLRDISHELRSPLARAQLALGLSERTQTLEQLPRMSQELDRLDSMLDELLTFSKLDAGQYQLQKAPISLNQLLEEIIAVNQVEADAKQQQLTLDSPSPCQLMADQRLLTRAIENVLRNAIKYSPQGSIISCKLTPQPDGIMLQLCDQGPGIAASHLNAVFEPFYRVSDSRDTGSGGTGLGLAIVAQIVRQHGGNVRAENRQSGGLCVIMQIPFQ